VDDNVRRFLVCPFHRTVTAMEVPLKQHSSTTPAAARLCVHHEKVEHGNFVFQVIRSDRVLLRSCPELGKDDEDDDADEESHFEQNELPAVDLIQPGTHASNSFCSK